MYEILFHPKADKELAKFDKALRQEIRDVHLGRIAANPYQVGIPLTGPLKGYFKYVIKKEGVSYRIVYEIVPSRRQVLILMAGKREGFYERLLRRVKR